MMHILLLIASAVAVASAHEQAPCEGALVAELSSNRSTYYVGEPLQLRLVVRNVSDQDVWGWFRLPPIDEASMPRYRRVGGRAETLSILVGDVDYANRPLPLGAGEQRESSMRVVYDAGRRQFVLAAPGEYELWARWRCVDGDGRMKGARVARVDSNVVHVRVEKPPDEEEKALAAYIEPEIGLLMQVFWDERRVTPEVIREAAAFVEAFPDSLYAKHVRRTLTGVLASRIKRKLATDDMVRLYEKYLPPEQH